MIPKSQKGKGDGQKYPLTDMNNILGEDSAAKVVLLLVSLFYYYKSSTYYSYYIDSFMNFEWVYRSLYR